MVTRTTRIRDRRRRGDPCKDFVGRRVELLRELRTEAGDVFKAGEVMVVASTHRGHFNLRGPDPTEWPRRYIFKVTRADIALIVN